MNFVSPCISSVRTCCSLTAVLQAGRGKVQSARPGADGTSGYLPAGCPQRAVKSHVCLVKMVYYLVDWFDGTKRFNGSHWFHNVISTGFHWFSCESTG